MYFHFMPSVFQRSRARAGEKQGARESQEREMMLFIGTRFSNLYTVNEQYAH